MTQSLRDFMMVLTGAGVYALVREVGGRLLLALLKKGEQKAEDAIKKL